MFNFFRLIEICENPQKLIENLTNWGLVPAVGEMQCPKCSSPMKLQQNDQNQDLFRWICTPCFDSTDRETNNNESCRTEIDFRHGTLFSMSSHLSYFQILGFAYFWSSGWLFSNIKCECEILDDETLIKWGRLCREVVLNSMIKNSEQLGGHDEKVEIYEANFGKRTYLRGKRVEGQLIYGGFQRSNGKVFMVCVEDTGSDALATIIEKWIRPGTTIVSDCWKARDLLNSELYESLRVKNMLKFEIPKKISRPNFIETYWIDSNEIVLPSGRRKAHIPGNLARYLFYKKCSTQQLHKVEEFFRFAGQLYNPLRKQQDDLVAFEDEEPKEDLTFIMLDFSQYYDFY